MARVDELLAAGRTWSFEFFPPATDQAAAALDRTLDELEPLGPSFVSVTYGAGGSTRERTRDIVVRLARRGTMSPMAHLTCVGHSRAEVAALLAEYRAAGVENILALAGDPPGGHEAGGDYAYAAELVADVRAAGPFSVGVAAHPEVHPRSPAREDDRRHLAAKLALADFAITQFFFDVRHYLALVEELAALGCDKPVIPGIMPVTNAGQVQRFAALAGAAFPADLAERIAAVADRPADVRRIGVEVATALCADLLDAGAPGLHFYTLNRSTATREIWADLGLAARGGAVAGGAADGAASTAGPG